MTVSPQTFLEDREEKGARVYVAMCMQSRQRRGFCFVFIVSELALSDPYRFSPTWFIYLGLGIKQVKCITHSHAERSHIQEPPCRSPIS